MDIQKFESGNGKWKNGNLETCKWKYNNLKVEMESGKMETWKLENGNIKI